MNFYTELEDWAETQIEPGFKTKKPTAMVDSLSWKFPYGRGDFSALPRAESVKSLEVRVVRVVLHMFIQCYLRFYSTGMTLWILCKDNLKYSCWCFQNEMLLGFLA